MTAPTSELPFWETKSLDNMSDDEWESLCDGCALCCLQKLEDQDSGEIAFTRVACHMLDCSSCRCSDYQNRRTNVPGCVDVRPLDADKLNWLPWSCAYRTLAEGRPLAPWHPLVSGDPQSIHVAGVSVIRWVVAPDSDNTDAETLAEHHIIELSDLPGQGDV